ncbi:MAG TPA: protease modulator HflC [Rhodobacteraceae bacterium]|nr:protease modulator HflC [Paracoccaceae bacterium]
MRKSSLLIPAIFVAVVVAISSVYIVDERERALRLWFGEVTAEVNEPGLYFKVPFLHEIVIYDDRIQPLDTKPIEVTMKDNRRFEVDAFARWRISDSKKFRRAIGAGGITAAKVRLDSILTAELREILGEVNSKSLLSVDRINLMAQIRDAARKKADSLGVRIIDVRIKRADLPKQNLDRTFERMRAEREREAADEIARGNEAAQRVRAEADRTVVETVSKAEREAQIERGKADAKRNAIYAEAFGKDREFFEFYRSLAAYRKALEGQNSTMVLSPDSEFFNYLRSSKPEQ